MKRRVLRRIALLVTMALLAPMAGVAETPPVEAALSDYAVYEVKADAEEENAAENEAAAELTEDASEVEPEVEEADEFDLTTDEDDNNPEGGDGETLNDAAEPEWDGDDAGTPDDTHAAQEDAEQSAPAQEESVQDAKQEPEADPAPVEAPAERAETEPPVNESAAEAPAEEERIEEDAAMQADAAVAESAPAETEGVELIEAEPEQPKLVAAASAVPAALMLGVKEKYSLAGMGDGFTTSNKKVAAVNAAGLITAKKKGTAIITVTAGGSPVGTCQLTVKAAPKKIKLPKKQTVVAGQSIILTPQLSGGYSNTITWTSSNPAVATVDAGGFVTAVSMGKAKITARTHNKKKAVCTVTVDSPNAPTSVAFPMGTLFVGKGESVLLRPVLNPGAETTFTYTSKNKKVVSVGKTTGVVKGKKVKKSTKITVKTQNGKKATLTVKVLKPAAGIELNTGAVTLDVGGAAGLTATLPANTASQVTWTSSNPGVATVSESAPFTAGNVSGITVTAVGGGSATITASTFNGKTATCQVTVNAPAPVSAPISVPKPVSAPTPVPELAEPSFSLPDTSPSQGEDMIIDLSGASTGNGESYRAVLRDSAGDVIGEYAWDSNARAIAIPTGELPVGDYSLSIAVSAPGYTDKTVDAGEIAVAASETLVAPIYALDRDTCRQGEIVTVTIKNADQGKGERYWVYITSESDDAIGYSGEGQGEIRVQLGEGDDLCPTGRYVVRVVTRAEGYDDAQSAVSGSIDVRSATLEDISYTLDPGDTVERGKPLTIRITTPDQGVGERYSAMLLKDETVVAVSSGDSRTPTIDTRRIARGSYALWITVSADGFADVTADAMITVTSLFDMENGVITGYNGPAGAVTIPETDYEGNPITAIGAKAFGNGSGVTQAIFPAAAAASIVGIADDAFEGCEGLSVIAPAGTYAHAWAVDNGYAEDAGEANVGEFKFEVAADGTATVIGYSGEGGNVTVPSMDAEGHPVVAIGKMAFRYNENIVRLTLPATLRSIGELAFGSCGALESCDIPVGVTEIGERAFEYCDLLVSCDIPESVTTLGDWAFYRCEALSPVVRSENVLVAGRSGYMPFIGCARIPSVPKLDCVTARTLSRAMTGFTVEGTPCVSLRYTFDGSGAETGVTASHYQVRDTETLVIPEGVTNIPYGAFSSLPDEVKEVVIPDTVTNIEDYAFPYCYGLETVTIPDSVKRVGKEAFLACRALTEVVIGDGVEEIGARAFDECEKLTAVTLGSGLKSIGSNAFNDDNRSELVKMDIGSLESWINLPGDTKGGLFLRKKTLYIDGQPASEISVPQGITEINAYAFMNFINLSAVTLPDSVKRIGEDAFYGCPALETVSGGNGLESLDVGAFYYCKSLKSIDLGENLREIGTSAFSHCAALPEIRIPDSVTTVGSQAFFSCTSIKSAYIGEGVRSIGEEAFYSCASLDSLYIGGDIQTMGKSAFGGCGNLKALHIPSVESWLKIAYEAGDYTGHPNVYASDWYVGDAPLTEIVVPDSITEIGEYAFFNCPAATSVTLHDGVVSVGKSAFDQCGGVPYVRVQSLDSASGRSLGRAGYAFVPNEFPALAFKYAFADDSETGLSVVALVDVSAARVEIPDGVTDIAEFAFRYATGIVSVYVPESVTSIGKLAFGGCTGLEKVEGMAGVTDIGTYAFDTCKSLREVAMSDVLVSIGGSAFYSCSSLPWLRIPDSVVTLGSGAFALCKVRLQVSDLDCPTAHLVSKAGYAFVPDTYPLLSLQYSYKNDAVDSLTAKEIVDKSATEITLPEGVTMLGSPGFKDCANLAIIRVPNSIVGFDTSYYPASAALYVESYDCAAAITLSRLNRNFTTPDAPALRLRHTVKNGVSTALTVISGVNADIESADIPDYVTAIYANAFKNYKQLETVRIGSGVTAIPGSAFYGCSQLVSVEMPDGVTSIGTYAFYGCAELSSAAIPACVTSIGTYAFSGCASLPSVTIPDGVTSIDMYAFSRCTSLPSVTIPGSVTNLGSYAFSGCTSLTTAVIGSGVTELKYNNFENCISLTSVVIPASVTMIVSAFYDCTALKTIYGTGGSYAETYATRNKYTFVDLSAVGSGDARLDAVVPKTVTLGVGQNYWPTDILAYATAYNIAYYSGNSAVVAIENSQWVAKQTGSATITTTFTAKDDPTQVIARQTEVTVGMRVSPQAVTLEPGQQKALSVYFDGMSATTGEWISDNTRVATVSEDGRVTGVKPGTATVTYRVEGTNAGYESWIESPCTVTVINNPGLTLEIGEDELVDYNVTRVNMKLTVDASAIEAISGQEVIYGAPCISFEMPHAIEACVPKVSDSATVDYTLSGGVASLAVPSLAGRSGSVDVSFEFTYAVTEDEAADFKESFVFNVNISGSGNEGDAHPHDVAFGIDVLGLSDAEVEALYYSKLRAAHTAKTNALDDAFVRAAVYDRLFKNDGNVVRMNNLVKGVIDSLHGAPEQMRNIYLHVFMMFDLKYDNDNGGYRGQYEYTSSIEQLTIWLKSDDLNSEISRLDALTTFFHEVGHGIDHFASSGKKQLTSDLESDIKVIIMEECTDTLNQWMREYRSAHPGDIPSDEAAQDIIRAVLNPSNPKSKLATLVMPDNTNGPYADADITLNDDEVAGLAAEYVEQYKRYVQYCCLQVFKVIQRNQSDGRGFIYRNNNCLYGDIICGVTNMLINGGERSGHTSKEEYWYKGLLRTWTNNQSSESFTEYLSSVVMQNEIPEVYELNRTSYPRTCAFYDDLFDLIEERIMALHPAG